MEHCPALGGGRGASLRGRDVIWHLMLIDSSSLIRRLFAQRR
jgi:hypothetical protein